ncbi:MAG: hypothetical protein ACFCGT_06080 [Sandaracinaceae bacterium]
MLRRGLLPACGRRGRGCVACLLLGLALAACGARRSPRGLIEATTPVPLPEAHRDRQEAADRFGRALFEALRSGDPKPLLYDDLALRLLLEPSAATRFSALRLGLALRLDLEPSPTPWRRTTYAGVCLQGVRTEPEGTVLGLRADGWVAERALVIGRRPGGRRVAAWVEGTFVYSDAGFGAVDLERVEAPRWEHTDLEIAVCDLRVLAPSPR